MAWVVVVRSLHPLIRRPRPLRRFSHRARAACASVAGDGCWPFFFPAVMPRRSAISRRLSPWPRRWRATASMASSVTAAPPIALGFGHVLDLDSRCGAAGRIRRWLAVHRGEVGLEGSVAELVQGARLPQYLPTEGVLQHVKEMHPAPRLGAEDEFGHRDRHLPDRGPPRPAMRRDCLPAPVPAPLQPHLAGPRQSRTGPDGL